MFTYRQQVLIPAAPGSITADLVIPGNASAIVIFAHAGLESRANRLNLAVARHLQDAGFGTLIPDLLDEKELLHSREFDINLLAARLTTVTKWLHHRDLFGHYHIGYYATTTAAAAALQAAAGLGEMVGAIVCRGGRPDLAREALPEIQSPVLLVVGSLDKYVLQLNREALEEFSCIRKLAIIQGATHFFADGAINEVAGLTQNWFRMHLEKKPQTRSAV